MSSGAGKQVEQENIGVGEQGEERASRRAQSRESKGQGPQPGAALAGLLYKLPGPRGWDAAEQAELAVDCDSNETSALLFAGAPQTLE